MSCEDCNRAPNNKHGIIYYRWGNARVAIVACEEHGKEIIEALNEIQEKNRKAESFRKLVTEESNKNEPN